MYIARKKCRFGDREYCVGETVPEALVDPNRVPALVKYGLLETAPDEPQRADEAQTRTARKQAPKRGVKRA